MQMRYLISLILRCNSFQICGRYRPSPSPKIKIIRHTVLEKTCRIQMYVCTPPHTLWHTHTSPQNTLRFTVTLQKHNTFTSRWRYKNGVFCDSGLERKLSPILCTEYWSSNDFSKIMTFDPWSVVVGVWGGGGYP